MPLVASAAGKRTGRQFGVFALRRDIVPCVQPGIRLRKRTFARRRAYKVVRAHRRRAPQNELLHVHLVELGDHPKRETGPWRHLLAHRVSVQEVQRSAFSVAEYATQ